MPRRTYIRRLGAAGGVAALAGCLDRGGDGDVAGPNETNESAIPDDYDPGLLIDGLALDSSSPVRLIDLDTNEEVSNIHYHSPEQMHWHQMPLQIPAGTTRIEVRVQDHEQDLILLGPNGDLTVHVEEAPGAPSNLVDIEVDGEILDLFGEHQGVGTYNFALRHQTEDSVWEAPQLTISVD